MKFFDDKLAEENQQEKKQQIKVLACTSMDNRYQITDALRANEIVVFNTDQMHKMDAMLMCEFISGFVHANHGVYRKITEHNFMVTPEGFEISDLTIPTEKDSDNDAPLLKDQMPNKKHNLDSSDPDYNKIMLDENQNAN